MNPELAFKLGQLIGALQDFLIRVRTDDFVSADVDRIDGLVRDVTKKLYASSTQLSASDGGHDK